jgi:tetratricopeptide (TPR) repeat protein
VVLLLLALLALNPNALPLAVTENFQRAQSATAAGDYAAAADALANASARLPYDGYIEYRAGLADISAQRFEPAIRRLKRAGDRLGWTPTLRVALGDAYLGYGDRAAAVEQWEHALVDLPADRALRQRLANNYEVLGRYPEAIRVLNQRVEMGDTDPALLYRLAVLTAVTEPASAIARLNVVLGVPGPFASSAQALLGAVEGGLNEGDEAYTYGRVGFVLIQLEEWGLAEYALTRALALNPQYADAHAYLGLALDMQQKEGEAAYVEAVRLQPDSPLAQYLLGLHYRRAGESTKALPYLQTAQKLDPDNPAIAAEIGGAYAAQNDLINA